MESEPIGLIGIGLMGMSLGRRLLDSGRTVIAFDVSSERRAAWEAAGGEAAASVAEVARRCGTILLAVLTTSQVEEVVEGAGGIAAEAERSGTRTVVCTSTCEPERIEALAARASGRNIRFIDAPVSGTSQQVLQGSGLGLLGGEADAIRDAEEILRVIYPRFSVTGGAGTATSTKLAVNLVLGLNRLAVAEGLVFAEKLGLEPANFLQIARESVAYSQVMDIKGPKMVASDYTPVSKVSQHLKDVRVMVAEAERRGQALPLATVLQDILEACERAGDGERDNAIMIEEVRRRRAG